MKIIEVSLRRPVTVLICTIALIIFGSYSYMNMGVERMPNVEFPIVVVRTIMEGASSLSGITWEMIPFNPSLNVLNVFFRLFALQSSSFFAV